MVVVCLCAGVVVLALQEETHCLSVLLLIIWRSF